MKIILATCLGVLLAGCGIPPKPFVAGNTVAGKMCDFERHFIETADVYVPPNERIPDDDAQPSATPKPFMAEPRKPKPRRGKSRAGSALKAAPAAAPAAPPAVDMASGQTSGTQANDIELPGDPVLTKAFRTSQWTKRPDSAENRAPDDAALFLSGGSLHGAFGAGYLQGWKGTGKLPNFAVVTGVSTGAILSTFAFVDRPDIPAALYQIDVESKLLTPLVPMSKGKPTKLGYVKLLIRGAAADLSQLQTQFDFALNDNLERDLDRKKTYPILRLVADGANNGRVLRVGVVDVDTGQAVSLDLGRMAVKWQDAVTRDRPDDAKFFKDCYIAAVVASSSQPIAALPVFIDNRMYVDGGVRFGAFADAIDPVVNHGRNGTQIYMIFNGFQTTASKCGRLDKCVGVAVPPDPKDSTAASRPTETSGEHQPDLIDPVGLPDPPDPLAPPLRPDASSPPDVVSKWAAWEKAYDRWRSEHAKWNFLGLIERSEDMVSNQIYRFSAASINSLAQRNKLPTAWFVKILPGALNFDPIQKKIVPPGPNTCAGIKAEEKERLHPIQFYPAYMKCIVSYGRWVAEEDNKADDGSKSAATGARYRISSPKWENRDASARARGQRDKRARELEKERGRN